MTGDEELPVDPRWEWDAVPDELLLLAGNPVTLITEDGVSQDTLVIAPGLFAHARRLEEGDQD